MCIVRTSLKYISIYEKYVNTKLINNNMGLQGRYLWAGSSVGKATEYGLDGLRIESRWGREFPHLSRPALGPTQPPVQWVQGLSWW
jgi:hypothetical protein